MPWGGQVQNYLRSLKDDLDTFPMKELERTILPLLTSMIQMGFLDGKDKPSGLDQSMMNEHAEIVRTIAAEGTVLLRNNNNVLPLKTNESILVVGKFADFVPKGMGSAGVGGFGHIPLIRSLEKRLLRNVSYVQDPTDEQLRNADKVVVATGREVGEALDYSFELPTEDESFIQRVINANSNTVVLVTSGNGVDMSHWDRAAAIMWSSYPGFVGSDAIADLLVGNLNPSGKLPFTIAKDITRSPGYGYRDDFDSSLSIASSAFEQLLDTICGPNCRKISNNEYKEGIYTGYRWYDKYNEKPQFPFGFGLSYSTFELSNLRITPGNKHGSYSVSVDVSNVKGNGGSEVVQLYIGQNNPSVHRPSKELKGFKKIFVEAGKTETVTIEIDKEDFSFWHPSKKKWVTESDVFTIMVGNASDNLDLVQTLSL